MVPLAAGAVVGLFRCSLGVVVLACIARRGVGRATALRFVAHQTVPGSFGLGGSARCTWRACMRRDVGVSVVPDGMSGAEVARLFDAEGDVQQQRLGRFLIAYLNADSVQAYSICEELALDPRGERVAYGALLMAMASALVERWEQTVDRVVIADGIRAALLNRAAKEGASNG